MVTYEMVYECSNCHTLAFVRVPFGESAPNEPDTKCQYCGCDSFHYPRKPKVGDYRES